MSLASLAPSADSKMTETPSTLPAQTSTATSNLQGKVGVTAYRVTRYTRGSADTDVKTLLDRTTPWRPPLFHVLRRSRSR
ncbi:unnamed protein product [Sphagnum jensenii]|uniref:Uncharacterized protein n=1 Tax=Sphagnum jensenii TaxID=128206 RepID=A0ABP0VEC1_9BRYO